MIKRILLTVLVMFGFLVMFAAGVHRDLLRTELRELMMRWGWIQGTVVKAEVDLVPSILLNFDREAFPYSQPNDDLGGGLAVTETGLMIAHERSGKVRFHDTETHEEWFLRFALPPINLAAVPERTASRNRINVGTLRYQDIETFVRPDGLWVAIAHGYYSSDQQCFVQRLQTARLPDDWLAPLEAGATPQQLEWRLLFETTPCLPAAPRRAAFNGEQMGGRILVDGDALLLSTGDMGYDGIEPKSQMVSQEDGSTWGRLLRINPDSGAVSEIIRGLRNPQGVAYDLGGTLWATDHGAMGGDELNRIVEGKNYGWPVTSFGVDYVDIRSDKKFWPANDQQGRHAGFELPTYAWVPSIAPGAMIVVDGLDPRWNGDLLVATLGYHELHRLRFAQNRVVYDEPIEIGYRMRDLAIVNGILYIMRDDGGIVTLTPRPIEEDDEVTAPDLLADRGCVTCHSGPQQPRLNGLVGGDIASQPGVAYSEGLRAVAGTWSREALRAFLSEPSAFAPGTTMPSPGLEPAEIEAVIDALESSRAEQ